MASILSLASRSFRTRSPARDAQTDLDRLTSVRQSITTALEGATHERDGLQQRVDVYHARASSLLDNSAEFSERSEADEDAIKEAEASAAAADLRIRRISEQIEQLTEMLHRVDEIIASTTSGGAA